MAIMLKCRTNRGVTSFRPPPGGPMLAMNWTSTMFRIVLSDRSYQPSWSIHCRSSSIGGWAPYVSSAGMFRSSTKMMHFMPNGGP